MRIQDIKKIRSELKAFEEILDDAERRCNSDFEQVSRYGDTFYKKVEQMNISGTAQSSVLKASFKVLIYKINKIL